jgi:hypothetical protein
VGIAVDVGVALGIDVGRTCGACDVQVASKTIPRKIK